jgi:hypothetical protein
VVEKEPARAKYRRGRERRPMVGSWCTWTPRSTNGSWGYRGGIWWWRSTTPTGAGCMVASLPRKGLPRPSRRWRGAAPLRSLPGAVYRTWQGSHFCRTAQAGQGPAEEQNGQVAQALHALGIRQILARSPQACGRGERAFGTIQGRRRRPDQAPRRRSDASLVFDRENAEPTREELLDDLVFLVVQGRAAQVRDALEVIDFHSVGEGFDGNRGHECPLPDVRCGPWPNRADVTPSGRVGRAVHNPIYSMRIRHQLESLAPLRHSVPSLIELSGSPSMSMTSPPIGAHVLAASDGTVGANAVRFSRTAETRMLVSTIWTDRLAIHRHLLPEVHASRGQ